MEGIEWQHAFDRTDFSNFENYKKMRRFSLNNPKVDLLSAVRVVTN